MIKHKKVKRIVLVAFMALCLFMGPLASHPKAATAGSGTAVSGSTTVCTYSWTFVNNGIYDIGTDLGIVKSSMHIDIDTTAYYSGALTITLSGTSSFANIGIFVKGGYLASTSYNQCKIQLIANVSHIEVDFISSIEFTSLPNWTVTISASGINKIDDLEHSSLDNIDDYTGRISAAVTSTTNGIPAIYNELDSIESAINVLQTYIDQIEGYIDNVEPYLNDINNHLDEIEYIQSFGNYDISQYSALLWPYYNNGSNTVNYHVIHGIPCFSYTAPNRGEYYDPGCIRIPANTKLEFYMLTSVKLSSSNVNFYTYNNALSSSAFNIQDDFFQTGSPYYKNIIYFNNTTSSMVYVYFEITQNCTIYPLFLGKPTFVPDSVATLYGFDFSNTYTRLMTATNTGLTTINNTLNGLKTQTITNTDRIVTALQNLQNQVIVNQNSQTVIDMSTNTTNTINQQFQTINNVELNILDGIGTKFNNVNSAIDQSGVISGSVNNTGIGWANYYSGIVLDNLTIVKYPVYIILIGFVLLCLLG